MIINAVNALVNEVVKSTRFTSLITGYCIYIIEVRRTVKRKQREWYMFSCAFVRFLSERDQGHVHRNLTQRLPRILSRAVVSYGYLIIRFASELHRFHRLPS